MITTHHHPYQNTLYGINIENLLALPHHVYLKNKYGEYLECNTAQAKSFGYANQAEVLGKKDSDFNFPDADELKKISENDLDVITHERPKIGIEVFTFADFKKKSVFSYKIPFYNHNGKVIGVFGTSILIEDNKIATVDLATPKPEQHHEKLPNNTFKASKRERECLEFLIRGMTAKEISRILNLSPRTIEFYIENMKRKFNCSNRIELIAKAFSLLKSD